VRKKTCSQVVVDNLKAIKKDGKIYKNTLH